MTGPRKGGRPTDVEIRERRQERIRQNVATWPPLTERQREEIGALLRPGVLKAAAELRAQAAERTKRTKRIDGGDHDRAAT